VDEAGQIGGKQMLELIRLVCERNAGWCFRATRASMERRGSDALLPLNAFGYSPVELHKIRRQNRRWAGTKRNVRPSGSIARLSNWRGGQIGRMFEQLEKMHAWCVRLGEQSDKLADEYVASLNNRHCRVVSQRGVKSSHTPRCVKR